MQPFKEATHEQLRRIIALLDNRKPVDLDWFLAWINDDMRTMTNMTTESVIQKLEARESR